MKSNIRFILQKYVAFMYIRYISPTKEVKMSVSNVAGSKNPNTSQRARRILSHRSHPKDHKRIAGVSLIATLGLVLSACSSTTSSVNTTTSKTSAPPPPLVMESSQESSVNQTFNPFEANSASITQARNAPCSRAKRPYAVVPPGEVTWAFRSVGSIPVSLSILAAPNTV